MKWKITHGMVPRRNYDEQNLTKATRICCMTLHKWSGKRESQQHTWRWYHMHGSQAECWQLHKTIHLPLRSFWHGCSPKRWSTPAGFPSGDQRNKVRGPGSTPPDPTHPNFVSPNMSFGSALIFAKVVERMCAAFFPAPPPLPSFAGSGYRKWSDIQFSWC